MIIFRDDYRRPTLYIFLLFILSLGSSSLKRFSIVNSTLLSPLISLFSHLVIPLAIIFPILLFYRVTKNTRNFHHNKNYFTEFSTSLILFFTTIYLMKMEMTTYNNYIYFNFGIKYQDIQVITISSAISSLIFLLPIIVRENKYLSINISKKIDEFELSVKNSLLLAFSMAAIYLLIFPSLLNLIEKFHQIDIYNQNKTTYGNLNEYINIAEKFIGTNNILVHPPQGSDFPYIGNQPVIRYYLFPRILISGGYRDSTVYKKYDKYFFIESTGTGGTKWPINNVTDREISFDQKEYQKYKTLTLISSESGHFVYEITFDK